MVRITYQGATIILTIVVCIIIPLLVTIMRGAVRWSKVEGKVDVVIRDLERMVKNQERLVDDKDKIHADMLSTMRDDRAATDRRLRWLEEHLWKVPS